MVSLAYELCSIILINNDWKYFIIFHLQQSMVIHNVPVQIFQNCSLEHNVVVHAVSIMYCILTKLALFSTI